MKYYFRKIESLRNWQDQPIDLVFNCISIIEANTLAYELSKFTGGKQIVWCDEKQQSCQTSKWEDPGLL